MDMEVSEDDAQRLLDRKRAHERFWRGEGPSLLLVPTGPLESYDMRDYARRFDDPQRMWEAEMGRARPALDWPTDGIPTVRPNLGTVFVPSLAGQEWVLHEGQMPWRGPELGREAILAAATRDLATQTLMRRALEFYAFHRAANHRGIAAYHPDTQGVFDIAHLLVGDTIFMDLCSAEDDPWIDQLMRVCLRLYTDATHMVKAALGEPNGEMIHGHGTPQGVYFPHAGTRVSEDTLVLLSRPMIESIILPWLRQSMQAFGGAFAHFCGRRTDLFTLLCEEPLVRAIDLGNPEMYDTAWLLDECARTGTVLYSRLPAEFNESWRTYLLRIGSLVRASGARVILRPTVLPENHEEALAMLELWHEVTMVQSPLLQKA